MLLTFNELKITLVVIEYKEKGTYLFNEDPRRV